MAQTKKKKKNAATRKPNKPVVSAKLARAGKNGMPKKGKGHRRRGKRNPVILGQSISATDLGMALLAGLVGVTVTKLVPPMLPESIVGSDLGRVAASAVVAVGAGYVAKEVNPKLGLMVAFGGGMQVMSILLNRYVPGIGARLALQGAGRRGGRRGVGALVPTQTPINVFNPLLLQGGAPAGQMHPAAAATLAFGANSSGVYGSPYN